MEFPQIVLPIIALLAGLALLIWSADLFIGGSAALAKHAGMSPFLIGMIVVGFGTSTPELLVSAISSFQHSPGIALGNAYGSNIANIALILGITAVMRKVEVPRAVCKKEMLLLVAVTIIAAIQLIDGEVSRIDAAVIIVIFAIWLYRSVKDDSHKVETIDDDRGAAEGSLPRSLVSLFAGLILLLASSRSAVWGAVEVAHLFGVSDIIIGLTIVAVGTSLPELASSIAASRKNEHGIVLGNIIGSNLFNTLAVVGIAGLIRGIKAGHVVLYRDVSVMMFFTVALMFAGFKYGNISKKGGFALLCGYLLYLLVLARAAYTGS